MKYLILCLCALILGGMLGILAMSLCCISGRESREEEMAMEKQLYQPVEDQFHKYPVLRIPTGKKNDQLIIGLEKARAIITWYREILKFVEKHRTEIAA